MPIWAAALRRRKLSERQSLREWVARSPWKRWRPAPSLPTRSWRQFPRPQTMRVWGLSCRLCRTWKVWISRIGLALVRSRRVIWSGLTIQISCPWTRLEHWGLETALSCPSTQGAAARGMSSSSLVPMTLMSTWSWKTTAIPIAGARCWERLVSFTDMSAVTGLQLISALPITATRHFGKPL